MFGRSAAGGSPSFGYRTQHVISGTEGCRHHATRNDFIDVRARDEFGRLDNSL